MSDQKISNIQKSYDKVADDYVARIYAELQYKPLDRQLLDRFALRLRGAGLACDIGCGPGHVARYLREQGAEVCGVDLSSGMIEAPDV
jgi:2-polyprenyl-3-methyl-5-hydroxy-6-metoxy-1,4-benzoquinol methylase